MTQLVTMPSALAVSKQLGVNSVAELIALLKREPGKYNFGSIGNGSVSHLSMEAIALKSGGAKMVHVPYASLARGDDRAAAQRRADGGSGRDFRHPACRDRGCENPRDHAAEALGFPARHSDPEGSSASMWRPIPGRGLIAPGGTPAAIIDKINKDVVEAIRTPAIREKLASQLMEPVGNSPAEFRAVIDAEISRWEPIIKAAEVKIN